MIGVLLKTHEDHAGVPMFCTVSSADAGGHMCGWIRSRLHPATPLWGQGLQATEAGTPVSVLHFVKASFVLGGGCSPSLSGHFGRRMLRT